MTRDEILTECKTKCAKCAAGNSVTTHLGGAEWIHVINNHGQYAISLCEANDIRLKYKDILANG